MFSLSLSSELQSYFSEDPRGFDALMDVEGEVFREVKGRRTVRFERGGRRYFLKAHRGVGLRECFKNLLSLKLPVLGARPEWRGIEALERAGVATMKLAGRGERGVFPGSGGSLIVTEAIEGALSLEELLQRQVDLTLPQRDRLKRALIDQLGEISRRLHEGGINHRDYYICHFLTPERPWADWRSGEELPLFVIDLHRVQIRNGPTPVRWRVKDLGALMYSAFAADLTVADALRFIRAYYGRSEDWKARYRAESGFWFRVAGRALGFQREWDRQQAMEALREGS